VTCGFSVADRDRTKLTSTDTTERNAGMLRVPLVASLVELATGSCCASPWVVVAVAHRRI
jgi:hypothetical protein